MKNDKNRYELASSKILKDLPSWKRHAIADDQNNKNFGSSVMEDFAKKVVELAESDIVLTE